MSNLSEISNTIRQISLAKNSSEEKFFAENPPIKEFSIERNGELVHYGVWEGNEEDFMIIFKTPDGKYHFRFKSFLDKILIKELYPLIVEKEI